MKIFVTCSPPMLHMIDSFRPLLCWVPLLFLKNIEA